MSLGRTKTLVNQGILLAVTSIVVRVIGLAYRMPLVNLLGDEGMGYYSNAFNIYVFALMISSFALPSAISKLVAERMEEHKLREAHDVFHAALFLGIFVGTLFALILYFFAGPLAWFIGNEGSKYSLMALAPAIFFFSIMGVLRGYFQGLNSMVPTAISQLVEQVLNAVFSIAMVMMLLNQGFMIGAAGGTIGTAIGTFAGLLTLVIIYLFKRHEMALNRRKDNISHSVGIKENLKMIIFTCIPIIIGTSTANMIDVIDTGMFQNALRLRGVAEAIISTKSGILGGKYTTLIMLPLSINASFAVATLPAIARAKKIKDMKQVRRLIDSVVQITAMFSIAAGMGYFVLAEPMITVLFNRNNIDIATNLLRIGSISLVFFSVQSVMISSLQGMNLLRVPVVTALFAMFIKIIINFILFFIFKMDIYGAVISTVIFSIISAGTNYYVIRYVTRYRIKIGTFYLKPFLAAVFMGIGVAIVYDLIYSMTQSYSLALFPSIIIGGFIYLVGLIKLRCLNEENVNALPLGRHLSKIVKLLA